jgi:uncharacterized membrane protein YkvA (DUF1232 family)
MLLRTGRLVLRLVRDPRVPLYTKLVLVGVAIYVVSPLDIIPDFIPGLGELDDLAVLTAGLSFFIKLCPEEIVEEHEIALGLRGGGETIEGHARRL